MYKQFILFIFLFGVSAARSQEVIVPQESRAFILAGFEPLDYVTGDFNGDKKKDAILILKQPNEDNLDSFDVDSPAIRPMLLLIRQANGKLKQVLRNDHAIMCRQCGGVFGDPYNGVELKPNGFMISFYGGSNWRWGYDYQFTYKPLKKTWLLTKEYQNSYNTFEPDKMKETTIDETELGAVTIDAFNSDGWDSETKWKVKTDKTFFYDNPKIGSKPRKGYLLKGNLADGSRELAHFVLVTYIDEKENISTGYVLKKDLERQ